MDLSRWISLGIAVVYVVGFSLVFLTGGQSETVTSADFLRGVLGVGLWLVISLGCIWWGEELGEGLVGAKFGLISSTSPGWAVKLMGWVLLFLPAILVLVSALREETGG